MSSLSCSSNSKIYYCIPPVMMAVSVIGIALSIISHVEYVSIAFGVNAACALCIIGLVHKYQTLKNMESITLDLKKEIIRLTREGEIFQAHILHLGGQISIFQKQIFDLSQIKQQIEASIAHLTREHQKLAGENSLLKKTSSELSAEVETLKTSNSALGEMAKLYQSQLESFQRLSIALETFSKESREDFQKAVSALHRELTRFQEENDKANRENAQARDKMALITSSLESTFMTIRQWIEEDLHKRLVETHSHLRKEVEEMRESTGSLKSQSALLGEQISHLQLTRDALKVAVDALKEQVNTLRAENSRYGSENERLSTQLKELQSKIESLKIAV